MLCLATLAADLKSLGKQLPDCLIALQTSPIATQLVEAHILHGNGDISVARTVDSLVSSGPILTILGLSCCYSIIVNYPSVLRLFFYLISLFLYCMSSFLSVPCRLGCVRKGPCSTLRENHRSCTTLPLFLATFTILEIFTDIIYSTDLRASTVHHRRRPHERQLFRVLF